MTKCNTSAKIIKPDTVEFGELAIAAGMAGKPAAVCFTEAGASVVYEL